MADIGADGTSLMMGAFDASVFTGRDEDLILPGDSLFGFSAAAGIDAGTADVGGGCPSLNPPFSFQANASLPPDTKASGATSQSTDSHLNRDDRGLAKTGAGASAGAGDSGGKSPSPTPSLLQSLGVAITSAAARTAAAAAATATAENAAGTSNGTTTSLSRSRGRAAVVTIEAKDDATKPSGGGGGGVVEVPAADAADATPRRPVRNLRRPRQTATTSAPAAPAAGTAVAASSSSSYSSRRAGGARGANRRAAPGRRSERTRKRRGAAASAAAAATRGANSAVQRGGSPPCSPPARRTRLESGPVAGKSAGDARTEGGATTETARPAVAAVDCSSADDAMSVAGMELIPGFEDTIDSHFMTALLQGSDAQSGVVPAACSSESCQGLDSKGKGVDLHVSLGLAEALVRGCETQPGSAEATAAASADLCGAAGHERKQEHLCGSGHQAGARAEVETNSPLFGGHDAASGLDREDEVSAQPIATAEVAAPSSPLPWPPPPPPAPPSEAIEVAAAAPAPKPSSVSAEAAPPTASPVSASEGDTTSGAAERPTAADDSRGAARVGRGKQKEKPATARAPRRTARERPAEDEAKAGTAEVIENRGVGSRRPAAPMGAETPAPLLSDVGRSMPTQAQEAETCRGEPSAAGIGPVGTSCGMPPSSVVDANGNEALAGGGQGADATAPLPDTSPPPPGVAGLGGASDDAAGTASTGRSASGCAAPDLPRPAQAAETDRAPPRPLALPRKVSLRLAPRDGATEKKVAERGYIPFQKLSAPLSKPLQAVLNFMMKKWSEVACTDLNNIRIVCDAVEPKGAASPAASGSSKRPTSTRASLVWGAEHSRDPLADLVKSLPCTTLARVCEESVLDLTYTFLPGPVGPPPSDVSTFWANATSVPAASAAAAPQQPPLPPPERCPSQSGAVEPMPPPPPARATPHDNSGDARSSSGANRGSPGLDEGVVPPVPVRREEVVTTNDGDDDEGEPLDVGVDVFIPEFSAEEARAPIVEALVARKRSKAKGLAAARRGVKKQRRGRGLRPTVPTISLTDAICSNRYVAGGISNALEAQAMGISPFAPFLPDGIFARMHTAAVANAMCEVGRGVGAPQLRHEVTASQPEVMAAAARKLSPAEGTSGDSGGGALAENPLSSDDLLRSLEGIFEGNVGTGGAGSEDEGEGAGVDGAGGALMGENTCMALFGGSEVHLLLDPQPPPQPTVGATNTEEDAGTEAQSAPVAAEEAAAGGADVSIGGTQPTIAPASPRKLEGVAESSAVAGTVEGFGAGAIDLEAAPPGIFEGNVGTGGAGSEDEGEGAGGVGAGGVLMGENTCMALFGGSEVHLLLDPPPPPQPTAGATDAEEDAGTEAQSAPVAADVAAAGGAGVSIGGTQPTIAPASPRKLEGVAESSAVAGTVEGVGAGAIDVEAAPPNTQQMSLPQTDDTETAEAPGFDTSPIEDADRALLVAQSASAEATVSRELSADPVPQTSPPHAAKENSSPPGTPLTAPSPDLHLEVDVDEPVVVEALEPTVEHPQTVTPPPAVAEMEAMADVIGEAAVAEEDVQEWLAVEQDAARPTSPSNAAKESSPLSQKPTSTPPADAPLDARVRIEQILWPGVEAESASVEASEGESVSSPKVDVGIVPAATAKVKEGPAEAADARARDEERTTVGLEAEVSRDEQSNDEWLRPPVLETESAIEGACLRPHVFKRGTLPKRAMLGRPPSMYDDPAPPSAAIKLVAPASAPLPMLTAQLPPPAGQQLLPLSPATSPVDGGVSSPSSSTGRKAAKAVPASEKTAVRPPGRIGDGEAVARLPSVDDVAREVAVQARGGGGGGAVTACSILQSTGEAGAATAADGVMGESRHKGGESCSNGGDPAAFGSSGGGRSRRPDETSNPVSKKVRGAVVSVGGAPSGYATPQAATREKGTCKRRRSGAGDDREEAVSRKRDAPAVTTSGGPPQQAWTPTLCAASKEPAANVADPRVSSAAPTPMSARPFAFAATRQKPSLPASGRPPPTKPVPTMLTRSARSRESRAAVPALIAGPPIARVYGTAPTPLSARPFAFAAAGKRVARAESRDGKRARPAPASALSPHAGETETCGPEPSPAVEPLTPKAVSSVAKIAEIPRPIDGLVMSHTGLGEPMSAAEVHASYAEAWSSFPSCFWEEPVHQGGCSAAGERRQAVAEGPVTRWLGLPRAESTLDGLLQTPTATGSAAAGVDACAGAQRGSCGGVMEKGIGASAVRGDDASPSGSISRVITRSSSRASSHGPTSVPNPASPRATEELRSLPTLIRLGRSMTKGVAPVETTAGTDAKAESLLGSKAGEMGKQQTAVAAIASAPARASRGASRLKGSGAGPAVSEGGRGVGGGEGEVGGGGKASATDTSLGLRKRLDGEGDAVPRPKKRVKKGRIVPTFVCSLPPASPAAAGAFSRSA